jgi:hypothetical protein
MPPEPPGGLIYKLGWDVPVDFSQPAKWFRLAADVGIERAQQELKDLPQVVFLSNEVQPPELSAGRTLKINSILEVSAAAAGGTVPVTLERQVTFHDQPLFRSPKTESRDLPNGQHTISFEFAVPASASPGTYKVKITLRALGSETTKETVFLLR